ncbi:MAG: hypothetical protein WHT22_10935 [Bacteroidales bacterium]
MTLPPLAGCSKPQGSRLSEPTQRFNPFAALPTLNLALTLSSLLYRVELLKVNQSPVVSHGGEPLVGGVVATDAFGNLIGSRADVKTVDGDGVNDIRVVHNKKKSPMISKTWWELQESNL